MIQADELRLGNLIHFPYLGSNVEVIGIALKDDARLFIQTKLNNNYFFELPEKYNPIELTEEWLIKFGFEKDDTGVDVFDQDYFEWYQKEFPIIGMLSQSNDKSYIFDENTDTLKIYYVHQLQNLYWCLIGKELIIK